MTKVSSASGAEVIAAGLGPTIFVAKPRQPQRGSRMSAILPRYRSAYINSDVASVQERVEVVLKRGWVAGESRYFAAQHSWLLATLTEAVSVSEGALDPSRGKAVAQNTLHNVGVVAPSYAVNLDHDSRRVLG